MPQLSALVPIFTTTILPVLMIALTGYLLASYLELDSRSLGRILFYIATPALVFRSLYTMEIEYGALQRLALVAATVTLATATLGWLIGYDQERRRRAALILTSAVSNNGNMGIPISYFAFGEIGLALGSLYYVVVSFFSNTLGVVVASAGHTSVRAALGRSLRVPMLYAAALGLLLNGTSTQLPVSVTRSVDLLAGAAIPGMLILLGIQLHAAPIFQRQAVIARSGAVRLLFSPLLAWGLCRLLGVSGVERNVLVLQAAMPTAVMAAVLTTEYDTAPRLVATIILLTTLFSMVTLSVLLGLLQ